MNTWRQAIRLNGALIYCEENGSDIDKEARKQKTCIKKRERVKMETGSVS